MGGVHLPQGVVVHVAGEPCAVLDAEQRSCVTAKARDNVESFSAKQIELKSLNTDQTERTLTLDDVAWIARVVWASQ